MAGIEIAPAGGVVVVRAGGAVLGESRDALVLREPGHDPVFYIPREDFETAFLERSDTTSHCPTKGDATWYAIVAKSGPIADACWSYEDPPPEMEAIRGRLAFDRERVAVERL